MQNPTKERGTSHLEYRKKPYGQDWGGAPNPGQEAGLIWHLHSALGRRLEQATNYRYLLLEVPHTHGNVMISDQKCTNML